MRNLILKRRNTRFLISKFLVMQVVPFDVQKAILAQKGAVGKRSPPMSLQRNEDRFFWQNLTSRIIKKMTILTSNFLTSDDCFRKYFVSKNINFLVKQKLLYTHIFFIIKKW